MFLPLAIEDLHLALVVAGPSDRGGGDGLLDVREVRRRQCRLEGAEGFIELLLRPRSDDGDDALALGQNPGDRELRCGDSLLGRDLLQRVDEPLVLLAVVAGEAGHVGAEVALTRRLRTAEQST